MSGVERSAFHRHVVDGREARHVPGGDALEHQDLVGDPGDLPERIGVQDALLVHDPQDDHVLIQAEGLLNFVIPDPDCGRGREHVLGVRVCPHLRKLGHEENGQDYRQSHDQPGMLNRKFDKRKLLHVRLLLR